MYKLICPICKKEYESPVKNRKTCSKECSVIRIRQNAMVKITCDYCGKEFERIRNRVKPTKNFCSVECRAKSTKVREVRNCSYCGKTIERKKSSFKNATGDGERVDVYCSRECMAKHYFESGKTAGENNGCWTGGKDSYRGDNWFHIRNEIRQRDNYMCQNCGITEEELGMQMSVHHIIPYILFKGNDKLANQHTNLISLCESCHRLAHSGDNHPSHFYEKYKDFIEQYEEHCSQTSV